MKWMFALALFLGCGGSQKEVFVKGSDLDVARVAGDWQGEYKGNESGRSGPVSFSLQMGSHTAEGQVIMNGATPLKIELVSVDKDEVRGTIAPYTDPSCSCEVQTTFLGTIVDDTISGTFESKISKTGQVQTGTWSVFRKQ